MSDLIRQVVLPKLEHVRKQGGYWMASCPAHEDDRASLSVEEGQTQPVLLNCFAGCEPRAIVEAMGLTWEQICADSGDRKVRAEWTPYGEAIAVYDYTDEDGKLIFQVLRTATKQFPQRVPDVSKRSGWRWSTTGVRRVPYRLPRLIQGVSEGDLIWIAEGEKDVQSLEAAGAVATCPPGGSNDSVWLPEYTPYFEGACVRIVADADRTGRAHARRIFAALDGVAAAVEIVEAAVGKDASDHLAAGKTLAEFEMTRQTGDDQPDLAPDLYVFISEVDPAEDWVIKNVLERGDRLIWTSREGMGKSMIVRQMAVAAAAGLHPFKGTIEKPVKVLLIDAENPLRKSRRHFRTFEQTARFMTRPVPEGGLRLIHRPEGINLASQEEVEWLMERVTAHRPDLLVIGPLYKLHAIDANEELGARAITVALDAVRVKADCALIIEAHSPHDDATLRPIGSSLFRRWPEFGYGMAPVKEEGAREADRRLMVVRAWRGPRDEREFPRRIRWGKFGLEWPWVEVPFRDEPPLPNWNG